jgi:hypothetical protein
VDVRKYILSLLLFAAIPNLVSSNDIQLIYEDYCKTVLGLPDVSQLQELDSIWAKILNKMSKGRLTEYMLEHFSENKISSAIMAFAHYQAEKLSREFCNLPKNSPRRSGDEVDAVRHFVWVSLLAQYLGLEEAKKISHLQEYRNFNLELDKYSEMDIYNNYQALEFIDEYRKKPVNIWSWTSVKDKFILSDETLKNEAFKRLNYGEFQVIDSQASKCQRSHYPNVNP